MGTSLAAKRLAARAIRRADRWSLIALGLVLAVGIGSSLAFLNAAVRTDDAYDDYVEDAEVSDVVINPSISTTGMDHAIRAFSGVRNLHTDSYFLAVVVPPGLSLEEAANSPEATDAASAMYQVRGSTDGRYLEADRPVVTSGRLARGDHEVFLGEESLPAIERVIGAPVRIGTRIGLGFAAQSQFGDDVPVPLGLDDVTVVGIGRLPDEVLPDELYPRERLIVSPDLAQKYECPPAPVKPGMTVDQLFGAMVPQNCATAYRYYALSLVDGPDGVRRVVSEFDDAARRLSPELAPVGDRGAGYFLIASDRAIDARRVQRATQPTVTSLALFGIVGALATMVLSVLLVVRMFGRHGSTIRIQRAMGATRVDRAGVLAVAVLPEMTVGLALAVVLAFLTSSLAPVGVVRSIAPDAGFHLAAGASAIVIGVAALGVLLAAAITGWAKGRVVARARARATAPWSLRTERPERDVGVGAALGHGRRTSSMVMLLGCLVAVITVVTAIVFGANLNRLVTHRAEYGWPWSAAVITGSGYGDLDIGRVKADLDGRDDVRAWAPLGMDSGALVHGRPVPTVFAGAGYPEVAPPIVEGRAPLTPNEMTLGRTTAADLGVEIGDTIEVSSPLLANVRRVKVVGTTITSSFGQFAADRGGLGVGAVVPAGDDFSTENYSAVVIETRDLHDGGAVLKELGPKLSTWDVNGVPPVTLSEPVRPSEIVGADEMRGLPLLLGLTIGLSTIIGLSLLVLLSVRDRRHELGVLRVLGFTGRQLRSSVRWQTVTAVALALVVGLPMGWIVGRWTWIQFAERLGARSIVTFPTGWIVLTAVATVGLALVAAALPARRAGRWPSRLDRSEVGPLSR